MASKDSSDILMKVVRHGTTLMAEASTVFAPDQNNTAIGSGFEPGRFFEVTDFSFNLGASASEARKLSKQEIEEYTKKYGAPPPASQPAQSTESKVVDIQPVTFSRQMDIASTVMFLAMTTAETLDSISIIKRKGAGSPNSGEIYLRIDFTKALLIGMDWEDDDQFVQEKWKFICRKVDMRYRSQKSDGTLGPVISGSWSMIA